LFYQEFIIHYLQEEQKKRWEELKALDRSLEKLQFDPKIKKLLKLVVKSQSEPVAEQADMNIGRDCSSPLLSGSLALTSIPLRSQTLPYFPGQLSVDMQNAPGLSRCSGASGCSRTLLTPCSASYSSLLIVLMRNAQ
jgi:hypothetical protein